MTDKHTCQTVLGAAICMLLISLAMGVKSSEAAWDGHTAAAHVQPSTIKVVEIYRDHIIELDPIISPVVKAYAPYRGIARQRSLYDTPWSYLHWWMPMEGQAQDPAGVYMGDHLDLNPDEVEFLRGITSMQLESMYYIDQANQQVMTEDIGYFLLDHFTLEMMREPGYEGFTDVVDEYTTHTVSYVPDPDNPFEIIELHEFDTYTFIQDTTYEVIAFAFDPIPEPATLALLAAGGAALRTRRRRA